MSQLRDDNTISFSVYDSTSTTKTAESAATAEINTWYHVAAVEYDDGTIDFYIDGVKASGSVVWNSPSTIKKVANSDQLRIGDIHGWDQQLAANVNHSVLPCQLNIGFVSLPVGKINHFH